MSLILRLVNETTLPDGGPVSFELTGKRGIDIGRAAHLDWTLPDPTRYISSRHCEIRYKDGAYWLHDVSTNGTFLNGADHRMHAAHRLRNGDQFAVGHYLIAVTLDGAEAADEQAPVSAETSGRGAPQQKSWDDQQLWASEEASPPPIDPKDLRPARNAAPVHPDFLDWAAGVDDPYYEAARDPVPAAAPPDIDWSENVRPEQTAPPATAPSSVARERDRDGASGEAAREADLSGFRSSRMPPADRGAPVAETFAPSGRETESAAVFLRHLAKSAGLPEELLTQKEPTELAQQIGAILALLADNLMQLLNARQQAKRLARSSTHTMIEAADNNPLKFAPSAKEALSIMFGPKNAGYLNASRAIAQAFEDLKSHQVKTYAAMQHALTMIAGDLDPKAIERETLGQSGGVHFPQLRKGKLWDTYRAKWEAKIGQKGDDAIDAFMRYFAESYDRDRS